MEIDVELIPAAASYPFRHAILRPHQTIDEVPFKEDDEPGTATFGAIERADGAVVGVGTVFRDPAPFDAAEPGSPSGAGSDATTWRLRGWPRVLTPRTRASAHGARAVLDHVGAEGGELIWCNARRPRLLRTGGLSDLGRAMGNPCHGPHVVMWRWIEPERA